MPDGSVIFTPDGETLDESDPLGEVALRPEAAAEFIRLLSERGVHIIGKNLREEGGGTQFDFVDAPGEFWVFSSMQRATEIVQAIPVAQVTPYSVLGVTADFLLTNDFSGSRLVLNPRSRFEREITKADIVELRRYHTSKH